MKIMVTGSAGFIGSATSLRLLERGDTVIGIDCFNSYYNPDLKRARLARHLDHPNYTQLTIDLADRVAMEHAFATYRPERVVNLAAQAGVRYAATNPHAYVNSNVTGFLHVLEGCRHNGVEHLVFASTSSVYGANTKIPFSEHDHTEHPLTLYAATKKANELMAHSYASLFDLPCTGLRFFTVYGPWGRPDMAPILFAEAIAHGRPIKVFNYGRHSRSFTYIDDIVEGVIRVLDQSPERNPVWDGRDPDPATSGSGPYRLFNIGDEHQVELMRFIELLEENLGRKAILEMAPLQLGDVPDTVADVTALQSAIGCKPVVTVEEGVERFVDWYRGYNGVL